MREIRLGIVGSGFIAGVHCEALAQVPGARVAAHCDVDTERGAAFARARGLPRSFPDHRAMLAGEELDALILCVPNHLHHPLALDVIRAGKHLIVEKPLCLSLAQADELLAESQRAGVLLCYAEELCFVPKYARAKELADQGAIGRVYRVSQVEKHGGPYSPWFWQRSSAGGGILMDMGCHAIEFARWFLGKPRVVAVTAQLATVLHGDKTELEDDAILHLEFEGGQTALLETSWALLGGMDSCAHAYGTQGVLHADLLRGQGLQVFSLEGYGEYAPGARGWTFPDFAWCWNNGYPQEDAHFVECMRTGATPLESGQDGRAVLEIMLACYASAAEGRRVALPFRPPADVEVPVDLWLGRRR
ncbi:MAG TPA: Gfo/Idh/MocA family oxidoreductase [Myxococcota bacterium]|nr:Gfo/Idh/MocA family oxidoreductase [Myxococcota bacterium]HRY94719.1 Gfo/Idh/MocA family oxidoreductase [Myxococcota bacterium]HSA22785.1 Gfo/Idh/MocA family oxidoreductase [Myxococcota bacterium]